MVSHTLKLVILGEKLTSVKKIIAGGQTTVSWLLGRPATSEPYTILIMVITFT
jgi:hypothetical protein